MAVRKDEVQIRINFLTDESKQFARTITQTEKFRKNIFEARNSTKKLERELKKTNLTNERRAEILARIADNEKKVAANLTKVALSGRAVEGIDLSRLMPSQLTYRARQLRQTMQLIPKSAPEYQKLEKELKDINDELATARARTHGVARGFEQAETGISKSLRNLALRIGAAFAVDRLVDWGRQLLRIGVRSDALSRKSLTVLGNQLERVEERAESNAEAMGLTTKEYVSQTAAIADLLVPMGFQRKEAASISLELNDLSGALGEWTGGQRSAVEVSNILGKAILGEREQLKELGIAIKEEDVTNRLREKGLDKLTGKMREQAKATATLELITEKSVDAQRAFAEGNGTAIRNQAELAARIRETTAALATALLPVFERLLDVANFVTGALSGFAEGLDKFTGANRRAETAVARLRVQFNNEIETLRRGNLSTDERKKLIDGINERYPGYLENMVSETDSLEDLKAAQDKANEAFSERIKLLATQRAFAEIQEGLVNAEVEALNLQVERTAAQNRFNDAAERGKRIAGKDDSAQRDAVNALSNLKDTEAAITANEQRQEQLRKKLEQVRAAADAANIALAGGSAGDGDGDGDRAPKTVRGINAITEAIKELEEKLGSVEGADAYVRITRHIAQLTEELNAKQREFNNALLEAGGGTISPGAIPVRAIEDAGQEMLRILDGIGIDQETATLERQQRINDAIVEFSKRAARDLVDLNLEKNDRIYQADLARAQKQKDLETNLKVNQIEALQSIGVQTTEFLTGQQKSQKEFLKGLIKTLLTALEKQILLNIAGAVGTEAATKPFPLNLGSAAVKVAAIKAAFAVAKAGVAGFAEGGQVPLSGQRITTAPNIPTQPNGDNILATVRRGEVILNARQQAALGGPTVFQQIGVPGFSSGGRAVPNTTPTPSPANIDTAGDDNAAALAAVASLENKFEQYAKNVESWQRQFQVNVSYLDIEEAGNKLADVREDASL